MAKLEKPTSVACNDVKSAKWDEITAGRSFTKADVPTLTLLCNWYAVADKCMEDLDYNGEMQVAYQNDIGDIKAFPQLETLKKASAEIRALNKQLRIDDTAHDEPKKESKLYVILNRRARAANTHRA